MSRAAPSSPCWIVADAHGGANEAADAALLALLDAAPARTSSLLILGDLFLAWLGEDRLLTAAQREVLERLRSFRAGGGRVDFVVGNRDYLARAQLDSSFDRVIEGEAILDLGGVPTLVTHGDRLDARDRAYHLWFALSRSGPVTALAKILPSAIATRVPAALERRLSRTNLQYKTGDLPIPALEALGRRARAAGAARALVGHYHHDRVLDVPGGVPVIVAPAWLDHRRILEVRPGGRLCSIAPLND